MYTLEELQTKTFKELKAIGHQIDALPAGDKRCRQNWIDAIAGVLPLLLQLLEVFSGVELVAEVIEVQHQELIEPKFGRIVYPRAARLIAAAAEAAVENFLGVKVEQRQEPIETFSGIEPIQELIEVQRQEAIEVQCQQAIEVQCQEAIAPAAEIFPGVTFDPAEFCENHAADIENYFASFIEANRPPNCGDKGCDRLETAIGNNFPVVEAALPAIETSVGVTFSFRFLAFYSPPQAENIRFKSDADGQLSLLDFDVVSTDEPPDPDDFDGNMFAFWAAYDAWVGEDEGGFEYLEEPPEVSLDSFCEWAPCPLEWYEPETIETIETSFIAFEISPVPIFCEGFANQSSSTCKFLIPVFDAWCDHQNDKDEPPDTGIFARLPVPKPPSFPSASVVAGDCSSSIKKFARSATFVSARASPGGDAM